MRNKLEIFEKAQDLLDEPEVQELLEYCEKMELDFDLLKDIIGETAYKIETEEPANLQTGPAKRNDKRTIEKHLQMLEDQPDLYKIYCIFTESIIQKYHPK